MSGAAIGQPIADKLLKTLTIIFTKRTALAN